MKRLEPEKNIQHIINYVPDSLKTKDQLDYIAHVSNYIRNNRHEYLKILSGWDLREIEQAIRNFSREVENLRIHKEFSMVKIFKQEISLYKTAKGRMLKNTTKQD